MFKLLKNEYIKFSNSYINVLSFLAMLLPLVLAVIVWTLRKDSFIVSGMYNWSGLINSLQLFYAMFLSGIIPAFIAIFSIYYEIQERTLKNLATVPYSRSKILLTKIIYSCSIVVLLNGLIGIITIGCGLLLGFDNSPMVVFKESMKLFLPNILSILLIPMMILIALKFKSFMHGMVLTIVCSVVNFAFLSNKNAFIYPWAIPSNMYLLLDKRVSTPAILPCLSGLIVFVIFLIGSFICFRKMDIEV